MAVGKISILMTTNTQPFAAGITKAAGALVGFEARITETSSLLKGAFAGALGAAGALGIGKMITSASDLSEGIGKIGAIFGEQGKSVEAEARGMADAFGVSLNSMLDGAGKLGGLFKGAGFAADDTAKLSQQFNRLTLDASRFFNVPYDVAFQKIRSGLSGEAEPLRDFGVFLTADKIKAQALSMGLADLSGEISDQAKITATAALIQSGLADAQGNAAETATGAAAQIEGFKGRVENLVTTLGESLAPIAGQVLGELSTGIAAMSNLWEESRGSVIGWASGLVDSLGITLEPMNILQTAIGGIADGFQFVGIAFKGTQAVITGGIAAIVSGLSYVAHGFDYLMEKITGSSSGLSQFFDTWSEDLGRLTDQQVNDFKAAWSAPNLSASITKAFEKTRADLALLQKEALGIEKITPTISIDAGVKSKGSHKAFGDALMAGGKEAASAILTSRYGSTKDSTAANTKRSADELNKLNATQREMIGLLRDRQAGLEFLNL